MKKIPYFVLILAVWVCIPGNASAVPRVLIDAPVYTFDPVPEGVRIDHVFIVKNTGDEDLAIENVLPP